MLLFVVGHCSLLSVVRWCVLLGGGCLPLAGFVCRGLVIVCCLLFDGC